MSPSADNSHSLDLAELKRLNRALKRQGIEPLLTVKAAATADTRTVRAAIADANHRLTQLGGLDR